MLRIRWSLAAACALTVLALNVNAQPQNSARQSSPQSPPAGPAGGGGGFGGPLPGLSAADLTLFNDGRAAFSLEETPSDGIGPVFNRNSCAACHADRAIGGSSATIMATRFGTRTNNKFDPLIRFGGPVLQERGIIGTNGKPIPGERVPREATIVAHRRTTAVFGFGLVDAVPDSVYYGLAAKQATQTPATAGRVNKVTDLLTGQKVVGKFGWKAASPNLMNFAGDAYKEEMGITTKGWLRDADGRSIEEENPPQGNVSLLQFNPVTSPNETDLDDVRALANFMRFLAPPPRGPINSQVQSGEKVFGKIGCADCHVPSLMTGANPSSALSFKTFAPYSDFLIHDMGSLGDGIEQGVATGRDMRTAPLWGLRTQTSYLHDGRAKTLDDAILQHQGQGKGAADKFRGLSAQDKASLIAFLKSL